MFETIDPEELRNTSGGLNMRLTQYGYANDPYMDSYTRKGIGAYRKLNSNSIALTDAGLRVLGLSRRQVRRGEFWVQVKLKGGGVLTRRIDDHCPQKNARADLYMPRGFNRKLGDYADISLIR